MKFEELVPQIMDLIGGESNIKSLLHCSTRLRFKFYHMEKVNIEGLKSISDIAGVKTEADGVHLIIGQDVDEAYDMILKNYTIDDHSKIKDEPKASGNEKKVNPFFKAMGWLSDCLVPMLPALIASGLTTALITVLKAFGVVTEDSMTYQVIDTIASSVLKFIPVLVVYGTAKKLDVNPMISFAVIAALLSNDLWALAGDADKLVVFGVIPIRVFSYASTIFPAVMCVACQKFIQKHIKKFIPKMFVMFLEPLLTFLILVILMFVVLGPIGAYIGDAMANLIIWGAEDYKWLICFFLAGFGNYLVGSGMHYCMIPAVIMIFSQLGYDSFYGGACFAGAFALAGSVLGASFKTKNTEVKQVTTSTGITALIGVAEPAIYGVFFKYRSVMIADTIAGCLSGLLVGILGCNAFGMAPAGVTTVMLFAGDTFMNLIIVISVAFVVGFVLSYLLYSDEKEGVKARV